MRKMAQESTRANLTPQEGRVGTRPGPRLQHTGGEHCLPSQGTPAFALPRCWQRDAGQKTEVSRDPRGDTRSLLRGCSKVPTQWADTESEPGHRDLRCSVLGLVNLPQILALSGPAVYLCKLPGPLTQLCCREPRAAQVSLGR